MLTKTLSHKLNSCAIYCRLSRDDGIEESSSITNQKEMLEEYAIDNGFKVYKFYVDENVSGGNFNRPAFNEMISDINHGFINIVLIKDLSRLGRNYIQMGYYLEDFFPSVNVRCIAINDNYDSDNQMDEELTPFKNIINQWYLQDISKKIRASKEVMMKSGEIKTFSLPLYGYYVNEKFERVIDSNTAPIVKRIFTEYLEGKSCTNIAKDLTLDKIYLPGYYAAITYGYNKERYVNCTEEYKYTWRRAKINKILRNEEYTGTLITKKKEVLSITTHKRALTDPSKQYRFPNKFEGIITQEMFDKATQMRKERTCSLRENHDHPLNGFLFHAANKERLFYLTLNKKSKKKTFMNRLHHGKDNHVTPIEYNPIRFENNIRIELTRIVEFLKANLSDYKEYVYLYYEDIKNTFNKDKTKRRYDLNKKVTSIENQIKQLLEALFEDKISKKEYEIKNNELTTTLNSLNESLKEIAKEKPAIPKNLPKELLLTVDALALYSDDPFNKEFLEAFIDKIYLSKGKSSYVVNFEIHFKNLDEVMRKYLNDKEK